jgi:uncharacterized membrane protein YgdD (TMEM256/DUF423 family)
VRVWIALGALSALVAVALGAMGAHGIPLDDAARSTFETANRYHMWHALGVIAIALATTRIEGKLIVVAAALLFAGQILFPGALYLSSLMGDRTFAGVAPVGGVALMAGWLVFAIAALRGAR